MPLRARLAILLAVALVHAPLVLVGTLAAPAHARDVVLAQEGGGDPTGQEEEAEGQESQGGEGEGQGNPGAETGAGGETEGGTSTETGTPCTYQMARLSLVLLVLLVAGIFLLYHRLIVKRQRGEV